MHLIFTKGVVEFTHQSPPMLLELVTRLLELTTKHQYFVCAAHLIQDANFVDSNFISANPNTRKYFTGSLSGILEYYMNVRLLNFLLSAGFVLIVGCSYFVSNFTILTIVAVLTGVLGGQINVCNVSYKPQIHIIVSGYLLYFHYNPYMHH